jgi:hypothetical protein
VSKAGEAIVRGIERRARRVYYPRWIIGPLLVPSLFQRVVELGAARQGAYDTIRRLNERARAKAKTPA